MKKLILILLATMLLSGCTTESKIERFVEICQEHGGVSTVRDSPNTYFAPSIYLDCEPITPQQ
jgi:PBP1b-binding outer membrane lipoprotein LpoB